MRFLCNKGVKIKYGTLPIFIIEIWVKYYMDSKKYGLCKLKVILKLNLMERSSCFHAGYHEKQGKIQV